MNKYVLPFILVLGLTAESLYAQTATEALRLSGSNPFGTARNLGTGNSMFAIGPDFSVISSNPSGIGGYWRSEFLVSAGLSLHTSDGHLQPDTNEVVPTRYNQLRFPSMGFIVANREANGKWLTSNWAIGLNRVADYNQEIRFHGRTQGSITDSWREQATGISPNELNGFEEGLAYTAGAIYDFEEDNIYETDYELNNTYPLHKEEHAVYEGSKSELFIGYGANLDQKLLIGFTVNMPLVTSTQTRTYEETDGPEDGVDYFNHLRYTSYINTTGYGVNAKIGATFKPTRNFNLAIAFHTPTKLFLTDDFNNTLVYDYTDENHQGPITAESPYGSFQYALRTPWSVLGGIGIIAGQTGFVSASIKWTDYATMKFDYRVRGNGDSYEQEERAVNADIQKNFASGLDLNLGGELAVQRFRFRAGAMLTQSPYANDNTFDPTYACGFGFRDENYFFDLGYSYTEREEGYLPYETIDAPQPLAVIKTTSHRLLATVGLKF